MTLPFKSGSRDGSHPNAETIIHEQFPSCCLRSPWEDANCCWLSRESTHEIPHFWGMSYHHPQKYTQLFQQTKPPTYTIWTWIYPYVYIHMCYIYIYIHIVHPYVLRFWLLNSLALSLIVIGKKYPIPPNFKIFKAPSLGKTRPGLLNGFLHHFQVLSGCGPLRQEGQPLLHLQRRRSGLQGLGFVGSIGCLMMKCSSLASDSANCSVFVDDVWSPKNVEHYKALFWRVEASTI